MEYQFIEDVRLGIALPELNTEWENLSIQTQEQLLAKWEDIRGSIPDRIFELEVIINKKQAELDNEEDFESSCRLNWEIADLASTINDLWLWFRANNNISVKMHQ
ncbi:hypothetical protein [Massilibacterium senegalense]|uniref:hypothetical protein n=1 Tax=Massilibacterium senegalense TaxID=1632858 RepID=UPI0007849E5B|nr:hypothetical protein [Massilibacterium senegalense]